MLQITAAALLVAGVAGVVVDPQDLSVRDARVELACGGRVQRATTDQHGRFAITDPADGPCVLSITRDGFAPFRGPLDRQQRDPLVVRLQIAPVQQRIDVVAPQHPHPSMTFGSILLSADGQSLRALGATAADVIRYAQLMAGTGTRRAEVLVDGLPSDALPPLDAIAHISINGDPFSAEYADADVSSIDIITKAPSRKVRFFMGGDMPGVDGRDILAPALKTQSRFVNVGMMGPVPRLPVTFSASGSVGRASQQMPIQVDMPELGDRARSDTAANRSESGSLSAHYARGAALGVRGSFRESRAHGSNVGIGGITLRESASSSFYMTRDSRVTATYLSSRVLYEGGAVATSSESRSRANSAAPGITVGGDVIMGGAPIADSRRTLTRWTTKHVVRSRSVRPWTLGAVMSGSHDANLNVPNSGGTFYFSDISAYREALAGGRTGTWSVARGAHGARFHSQAAAAFAQAEILRRGELALSGGLRADYQTAFGVMASPRLSLAARWRDVGVRAGAGMFVQRVPERLFLSVLENGGDHLRQFIAADASLTAPIESTLDALRSIQSRMSPEIARPRALQWRVSAERSIGAVTSALEYSVSDERKLLGSDRLPSGLEWVDVFASDRRAIRRRVHAYSRYSAKGQQLVVEYEWMHARDNTDGPFSFPARAGDIAAEWARSAGVSPHSVTMMGALALPAEISLNVTWNWRSRAPFNITTGRDAAGSGLFLDRGGLPRNSGDAPGFRTMSLYAHRRITWPRAWAPLRGIGLNISVQADNILNDANYLSVGSVAGSATFGRPLAAYPGRSMRVLFSVS